jgi:ribosomal protein S18 acetylase RimI-like enzyme
MDEFGANFCVKENLRFYGCRVWYNPAYLRESQAMDDVEIRPLDENDADDFQRVRLRALKEHPEAFGRSWELQLGIPMSEVADNLRTIAESSHDFVLGCYVDGIMLGMVGFRRAEGPKNNHVGMIWGMYVAAEMQGRGLGRKLLSEAIGRARQSPGLRQITLSVVTTNANARKLYASLSFERYGLQREVLFVNGKYYDEEHMALYFDD